MATKEHSYPDGLYLEGAWQATSEAIDVQDLTDGEPFASVAAASPGDVDSALSAAEHAEREMKETTIVQRANWLEAIAEGIENRKDELAEVIVREAGEYVEGTTEGHEGWKAIVQWEPVGTVLCITPYNYPLATTALQVAPAIAAGNSVILKPATKTPVSGAILADIIANATEIPDGAFAFVPGRASEIGDLLAGDDRINAIAMTGSSNAGKHVASVSGMVDLHMELGGNAPALVFPDADLAEVTSNSAAGSFKYAGQRCSAVSRVLAHEDVHDEVVDRLEVELDNWVTGDLFDPDTKVGPLIS
ncbi:aldehyde dehydrogenase, partial [Halobacteriales archaeon QH_2_66_30]